MSNNSMTGDPSVAYCDGGAKVGHAATTPRRRMVGLGLGSQSHDAGTTRATAKRSSFFSSLSLPTSSAHGTTSTTSSTTTRSPPKIQLIPVSLDRTSLTGANPRQSLLARRQHEEDVRKSKEERRSSIFKSLDILDVDETADDYNAADHYQDAPSSAASKRKGRYSRRGSVTKYKMQADDMQPSGVSDHAGDESDYGSDYDSGLGTSSEHRRRYLRRGSVTKYSLEMKGSAHSKDGAVRSTSQSPIPKNNRMQPSACSSASTESLTASNYADDDNHHLVAVGDDDGDSCGGAASESGHDHDEDDAKSAASLTVSSPSNSKHTSKPKSIKMKKKKKKGTTKGTIKEKKVRQSRRGSIVMPVRVDDDDDEKEYEGYENHHEHDEESDGDSDDGGGKMSPQAQLRTVSPLPGHELYSANLDDSGHHQKNMYYDSEDVFHVHPPINMEQKVKEVSVFSPQKIASKKKAYPLESASAHGNGIVTHQLYEDHPLENASAHVNGSISNKHKHSKQQRRNSFINALVDETEMFRHDGCKDDDDDDDDRDHYKSLTGRNHVLETIGSVTVGTVLQPGGETPHHHQFPRRNSDSSWGGGSVDSDGSSLEFATEDFASENLDSMSSSHLHSNSVKKPPPMPTSKSPPKLPPSYNKKPPPVPPVAGQKKAWEEDSTSSSTRSEEELGNIATASSVGLQDKAVTVAQTNTPGAAAGPLNLRMNRTAKKMSERILATASLTSSSLMGLKKTKDSTKTKKKKTADTTTAKTKTKKKVKRSVGLKTKYPQPVHDPNLKSCLKRSEGTESSYSSAFSSSSFKSSNRRVAFGNIVITEFPIILGDNPAVTSGAPVTIDWIPQGESVFAVDVYEEIKPARRRRRKLLISVSSRAILLLAAGYSVDEIADASINAQHIKDGRQASMQANEHWERVALMMETTNGAVSGLVHGTNSALTGMVQGTNMAIGGVVDGTNSALTGVIGGVMQGTNSMVQSTSSKLRALMPKPIKHSETARQA